MNEKKRIDKSYNQLLKDLQRELAEGFSRAQRAYEQEKVISYWKIGKAISLYLCQDTSQTGYGQNLYQKLSSDLSIGQRLLYQMTQFYLTYPHLSLSKNIKWTHYRLLSTVRDERKRNELEFQVVQENLSMRGLEKILQTEKIDSEKQTAETNIHKKLSISKGRLYAYRVFKDAYAENLLIDCGFNIYRELEQQECKSNYIETIKNKDSFSIISLNVTKKQLYTYKAFIKKVIDGDTLWVIIDCGFKTWVKQKIRLRGINTPAIETPQGNKAFKFVNSKLKNLPFVIIKSYGRDKYDRYLSDLFYLEQEEDPFIVLKTGKFLNQELLDKRLAQRQG